MRKSIFVFLTMLLLVGLMLVACGGSQPAADETAAEEPAVEEPAAEEPAAAHDEEDLDQRRLHTTSSRGMGHPSRAAGGPPVDRLTLRIS